MRKWIAVMLLFTMGLLGRAAAAQENKSESKTPETRSEARPEPKPLSYYRLEFTISEWEEGKKLNTRSYSMVQEATPTGSGDLNIGSRVPVATGKDTEKFSYIDVGVNLRSVRVTERDGLAVIFLFGDLSSLAAEPSPGGLPPVLRSVRFSGPSVVAPGKPTLLYSLDDVNSKHRFQIELTATKVR